MPSLAHLVHATLRFCLQLFGKLVASLQFLLRAKGIEESGSDPAGNYYLPARLHFLVWQQTLRNATNSLFLASSTLASVLLHYDVNMRMCGIPMNATHPCQTLNIQILGHAAHSVTNDYAQPGMSLF